MSKYPINLINKEVLIDKHDETVLLEEISKKRLFEILSTLGYDFDYLIKLFEEKSLSAAEQSKFNIMIRKIQKEYNINIIDIILYFEETFVKFKKILSIFDCETKNILKNELSIKHNIKVDQNNLIQILS
jgi:hypothetical protein